MSLKLLFLAGDGIGPEVMAQAQRVLETIAARAGLAIEIEHDLIGGAAYDAYGVPLADATFAKAEKADAVFLGAVGGPQWDKVDYALRPEAGLLGIRKRMGLFANLRPAQIFDSFVDASSLKPELVRGLDLMIVRELTGGLYFGEPRGIETLPNGGKRGFNSLSYTSVEIERVARVAFELARIRGKRLCSVDKANVLETSVVWRETVTTLAAKEYPDIRLDHMYVDNCAMQLCRAPKQFDTILTENLFGDILSDEAAMLTGSLGMLPSASLGATRADGRAAALYEPVHGSAPDIAGTGKANPIAAILCVAMWLRISLKRQDLGDQLHRAIVKALAAGARTADIAAASEPSISTTEMGDRIIAALD
jgi:3-isopropylmalate dehydrogenase